jgi:hypothetical protein
VAIANDLTVPAVDSSMRTTPLYVGQFLLGSRKVDVHPEWRTFSIAESLMLTTHPDQCVVQAKSEDKRRQLTLVGEMMDPRSPERGNEEILRALMAGFDSRLELIEATSPLGGRWVLIGQDGDEVFLFHDALGLRQVFHSDPQYSSELWVMSQPGIAMDFLGLRIDPEAAAIVDSYAFRSRPEYRWPGTGSPVRELKRLLPNHVLDLKSRTVQRYWPAKPLKRISPEDAVNKLSRVLPGLVFAIARRHSTVLSLTAGIDSRLVLASARNLTDQVAFVTVRQGKMPDNHPDIVVPKRLLARLGLPHELIRAPATMSAEFARHFKENVFLAHDQYGPDAEAIAAYSGGTRIALTGSGAEVGRCPYRAQVPRTRAPNIDARQLARLQRMNTEPFALESFTAWLDDARDRFNVKLLDLFDWEQGHGSWLAMTQLEFDVAWRDIFTPFNSREVLTTLLGVHESHRKSPNFEIFRTLIKKLWPELLEVPINPVTRGARLRELARKMFSHVRFLSE